MPDNLKEFVPFVRRLKKLRGLVNLTEIGKKAGINRQNLYQKFIRNTEFREEQLHLITIALKDLRDLLDEVIGDKKK